MDSWIYISFLCSLKYAIFVHGGDLLSNQPTKMTLEIYYFENCPDQHDLQVYFDKNTLIMDPETNVLYVSGSLHIGYPLGKDTKQTFEIRRCLNEDELSCEKYLDYTFDTMCENVAKKNTSWTPFIEAIKGFIPKCPFKVGTYEVDNAPLNTGDALTSVSVLQGHWRLRYFSVAGDKVISCLNTAVEMKKRRG